MSVIEIKIETVRADAKLIEEALASPAKAQVLPITIISGSDNPDRYDVQEQIDTAKYVFGNADAEKREPTESTPAEVIEIPLVSPVPKQPAVPTVPKI